MPVDVYNIIYIVMHNEDRCRYGYPHSMSDNEIDRFLDSKMILLKSIIDSILSVSSLSDFIMRKVLKSVITDEFPNDSGHS